MAVNSWGAVNAWGGGGLIAIVGSTANLDYSAITASIDLASEIVITGETANFNHTCINGLIELTGAIDVIGQTAELSYTALRGNIISGEGQRIGTVTVNFKPNEITVNFKA